MLIARVESPKTGDLTGERWLKLSAAELDLIYRGVALLHESLKGDKKTRSAARKLSEELLEV